MTAHVLVWELEAVPDLRGFAAANGLDGKSDDEIRAARMLSCGGTGPFDLLTTQVGPL